MRTLQYCCISHFICNFLFLTQCVSMSLGVGNTRETAMFCINKRKKNTHIHNPEDLNKLI